MILWVENLDRAQQSDSSPFGFMWGCSGLGGQVWRVLDGFIHMGGVLGPRQLPCSTGAEAGYNVWDGPPTARAPKNTECI